MYRQVSFTFHSIQGCAMLDSNQRSFDYKSNALSTRLIATNRDVDLPVVPMPFERKNATHLMMFPRRVLIGLLGYMISQPPPDRLIARPWMPPRTQRPTLWLYPLAFLSPPLPARASVAHPVRLSNNSRRSPVRNRSGATPCLSLLG